MIRRSFGGGSGGMGGGSGSAGGGGGAMLRTLQRAVRTGGVGGGPAQEPFSHSTTSSAQPNNATSPRSSSSSSAYNNNNNNSNTLSLSSPTYSRNPFGGIVPVSATSSWPTSSPAVDEFDQWECVDEFGTSYYYDDVDDDIEVEEKGPLPVGFNCDERLVFGPVPSVGEVQHAVSSLHRAFDPVSFSQLAKNRATYDSDKDVPDLIPRATESVRRVSSVGSEIDWMEPKLYNSRISNPWGSNRVYDAFHLLQTEPSVQRMVISLSSDKNVWDAVLNNEVVQELRKSLDDDAAEKNVAVSSDSDEGSDDSEAAMDILSWIFVNTKAKILDLFDKITKIMDELFLPPKSEENMEKAADPFQERLRTSLLLSVVVFLVVVVNRANRA